MRNFYLRLLVAGLIFLLLSGTLSGQMLADDAQQTCQVPDDYGTIQEAVDDAACTVIEVGKGSFQENLIINRSLTINGLAAMDTIIDGYQSGRVIEVLAGNTLTLSKLTITNGLSPLQHGSGWRQAGGGILISKGELLLMDVFVTNNKGGSGGGISIEDSKVDIQASLISGNQSDPGNAFKGGGGISIDVETSSAGISEVKIIDSTIQENKSQELGGGLQISGGALSIKNTSFTNNEAGQGGALNTHHNYESEGAIVEIDGCSFAGNKSDSGTFEISHGGAIFNGIKTQMTIHSTTISANEGRASNIYNDGNLTLTNSIVANNTGPGIENGYSGDLQLSGCEIRENEAFAKRGAGIINVGKMVISESLFKGNKSYYNGGGVYNTGGQLIIIDTLFIENESRSEGGAIASDSMGNVTIKGSSFIRNAAAGSGSDSNGGAIANTHSQMSIEDSSIFENRSGENGGAIINVDQGEMTVTNSTINNNHSKVGGAVFNDSSALFVLSNCTLFNNHASPEEAQTLQSGWNFDPEFRIVNSILITDQGHNCTNGYGFTSLGHNIMSDSSCDPINSDMTNTHVVLFPFFFNDGRSLVYQLLPGSVAIDTARDDMCPDDDQRGVERPLDGDLNGSFVCDIGAYEFDPANPPDIKQVYLPSISSN